MYLESLIKDALLEILRIVPNSWKTFGQVRGIEPLSCVLSELWKRRKLAVNKHCENLRNEVRSWMKPMACLVFSFYRIHFIDFRIYKKDRKTDKLKKNLNLK